MRCRARTATEAAKPSCAHQPKTSVSHCHQPLRTALLDRFKRPTLPISPISARGNSTTVAVTSGTAVRYLHQITTNRIRESRIADPLTIDPLGRMSAFLTIDNRRDRIHRQMVGLGAAVLPFLQRTFGNAQLYRGFALRKIVLFPPIAESFAKGLPPRSAGTPWPTINLAPCLKTHNRTRRRTILYVIHV